MHVRWSAMRGMPIVDDRTQSDLGVLDDPLINPDTGRILGFFVIGLHYSVGVHVFLSVQDILSIGTKVHIRSDDVLSPPDELIRLKSSLRDPRIFLGQRIRTKESGRSLGLCGDIQFDTRHFAIEWLFPRGWLFAGLPIAVSEILEVTEEAIWVKDSLRRKKEKVKEVFFVPALTSSPSPH